jgi:5'(3')-deoxyribonucleotidase|tara:strand:- start:1185 stop:2876 length:1692 start_codon:yes stop_codon:yes gene_type:complete
MKFRSIKDIENFIPKKGSFKHTLRKIEEDGRIVKGVNTTADVDVNSISKEAGKFGNKVDKDGRPPTLSKKVKGSSTNVLYNLGMVKESVDKTDESMLQYAMLEAKVGELSKASEIYVDMDGVLADFFGEWAKVMKVDHYSKIDNVDINVALQKIRDTDDFWLKLPLLPQAKQLLELIKKIKGSYTICSSPLADDPRSEPHKREWIKKNLSFFPPKNVIITSNKPKYATQSDGTPNILIDDFGKNVNAWEAAGGEGFKYKDHKFERTAKELQQHLQEPATERELTKGEEKEKERIVKGMKKKKGDFKDRYGKDADAVMYATATKLAKEGKHIPNPKNAFITKADTAYDFIKIGTNMANLKDMPTGISNYDEPDIMIAPYAGRKEMKYLQKELKRLGYKTQDADGYQDAHYDDKPTGGKEPPQMKGEGKLGRLKISKMRPVHKKRKFKKLFNQLKRMGENTMSPITVDKHGHIVNGHHRYDALRLMGEEYATVRMIDVHVSETLDENFADGKKKGKSKPGRVKKSGASCNGSVTKLRTLAKKYSGERAKMYHWCANMKSGRKKKK